MKLKAVRSNSLSTKYDARYVLIDEETGEIVDDAQGYGYKSIQKAYAGGSYKFRDKSKDTAKAEKEGLMEKWMRENKDFVGLMDAVAFDSIKCHERFDAKIVKELLTNNGYKDLPFTANELLKYWQKGPVFSKKKSRRRKSRVI